MTILLSTGTASPIGQNVFTDAEIAAAKRQLIELRHSHAHPGAVITNRVAIDWLRFNSSCNARVENDAAWKARNRKDIAA